MHVSFAGSFIEWPLFQVWMVHKSVCAMGQELIHFKIIKAENINITIGQKEGNEQMNENENNTKTNKNATFNYTYF